MNSAQLRTAFQRAYCLTHSEQHWKKFIEAFPKYWPFKLVEQYEAVKPEDLFVPEYWTAGPESWAQYMTHYRLLRKCLDEGIESILIVEDTVRFVPDFPLRAAQFLSAVPVDWEMLYMGRLYADGEAGPQTVSSLVARGADVKNVLLYAMRGRSFIDKVVGYLEAKIDGCGCKPLDMLYASMCQKNDDGIYTPVEWLIE